MPTSSIITIPGAASIYAAVGDWSVPTFNQFLIAAMFAVGVFIGIGILLFIARALKNGAGFLLHRDINYDAPLAHHGKGHTAAELRHFERQLKAKHWHNE